MEIVRGPHPLTLYLTDLVCRTAEDPQQRQRIERFLAAIRSYQQHSYRRTLPEPPAIAQAGSARLLDFASEAGASSGTGPNKAPAVVFVPSLINPGWVLDLTAERSLLRWLAGQGVRPCLIDWGTPGAEERGFDLNAYVTRRLVPLLESLGQPVTLVGYCLGGTLATAASLLSATVERLALLAAPWVFGAYEEPQRQGLAAFAAQSEPLAQSLGVFPMEALQASFWALDPALMERKFASFAAMDEASPEAAAFVALEDWANTGAPLSLPAARQLVGDFFGKDAPGTGQWVINGTAINPSALDIPALVVSARTDRIVPLASSAPLVERIPSASGMVVDAGHVGMVVSRRAPSLMWEPLARWLVDDS